MEEADACERERRAALAMARKESREALAKQRNEQAAALLAGCAKLRRLPSLCFFLSSPWHGQHKTAWTDTAANGKVRMFPAALPARHAHRCLQRSAACGSNREALVTIDEQRAIMDRSRTLAQAVVAGSAAIVGPAPRPPPEARALPLGCDRHGTAVWRLSAAPVLTGDVCCLARHFSAGTSTPLGHTALDWLC